MSDLDKFWELFTSGIIELAQQEIADYLQTAVADGESFARKFQDDLENWGMQLTRGKLTESEVDWLIQAKKDLAEMTALKQAGLTQVRIDKFVNGVLQVAVKALVSAFPIAL